MLGKVLERGGIRLRPEAHALGVVRQQLPFQGRPRYSTSWWTNRCPVTVMVLRNERPASPVHFDEQGFAGRIVPAGPGSVAVIGADGADLGEIAARVLAAVEWLDD